MNQDKLNKDLKFGFKAENKVQHILEDHFNTLLFSTKQFATTDYYNDDFEIELKSRNNKHSTYPTTMIGQNKIEYMKKKLNKKRCILVFNFTDGVYYIELNKELLEGNIFKQNCSGGRDDRNINEYKNRGYCYIPISELTKI